MKIVLSSCVFCRRMARKAHVYPGPPLLQEENVKFSVLLKAVGVDYSGAITLSRDEREVGNSISFACSHMQ